MRTPPPPPHRRLMMTPLGVAWLLIAAPAMTTAATPVEPAEIEKLLLPYVGAAVLAIDDSRVVFQHCWGQRRLGHDEPVTPMTCFRLASVSKQFTATAVLTLVDQGKLQLTDTLDRFFTDGPDYWRSITVHHLLTHTSGLPDYESLIPEGTGLQVSDYNVLALLCDAAEPKFAAGDRFDYSNSGYALLALIAETVARRPYHDYLRTAVLEPAGMRHSVGYLKGVNRIADRAYGHERADQGEWRAADQSVTSAVRGDGSVYSSLSDLARWVASLDGGGVLSDRLARAAVTPQVKSDRSDEHYGYGWFIGDHRGQRRVWHSGSTRGFALMLQRFPERKAAVVILLNRSLPEAQRGYADRVVDRLLFAER